MNGGDRTLNALKAVYRAAGALGPESSLPTEIAFTLDDAEEIIGRACWDDCDRIGIDRETPAPTPEALAALIASVRTGSLVWRAQEGS